ncbi:hypothetical protein FA048_12770 [Pedobacter polaris]|uniref:Uncharacterized protein n=1 Tax=Pedobacter polaris TaxID=2571273 RepID=A0A4U1CK74_9SPHI|nr:hypothetical protein [Pedobacter polaris]TKC08030.1 hypothetical protein FA048_12770 [Pedobacter polaris]
MSSEENKNRIGGKQPEISFLLNEIIGNNNTSFKVIGLLRNRILHMEDLSTGNRFKLSHEDGLYKSLIQAKQNKLDVVNDNKIEIPTENNQKTIKR